MRNRVRRRLRAITREAGPLLLPGAYLVGVNAKATSLSYQELRATLFDALGALPSREPSSAPGPAR